MTTVPVITEENEAAVLESLADHLTAGVLMRETTHGKIDRTLWADVRWQNRGTDCPSV